MKDTGRMYGLDALRGVAMTLGIFLHSSIAYKKGYHYGQWVFDKEFSSYFFDWIYLWINSFRMQTFFLLAGFFARLLINKRGLIEFAKNRLKRIGLPLVVCYLTILPLTLAPYLLYVEFNGTDSWKQLIDFYARFYTLRAHSGFMHLWFLQHLLVYCGLVIAILFFVQRSKLPSRATSGFMSGWLSNTYVLLFLSFLVLGSLSLLYKTALPSIWTGFIIPLPQFLYYLFFFILGWIIEDRRALFSSLAHSYKWFVILGTALNFVVLILLNSGLSDSPQFNYFFIGLKFLFSLQTMLLVFGAIGLFINLFKDPKPFWQYIADSAYWVYLIHMPVVLFVQLTLLDSSIPGLLRFPLVVMAAILVSFGSYHFAVRNTWVGVLLNGRKQKSK